LPGHNGEAAIERGEFAQRRVTQRARQVIADAGQMAQIGRLAVAPVEPDEDAEDLGVALRCHDRIGGGEAGTVETRPRACSAVGVDDPKFQFGRDGDARIHRQ
jgi:hypothetical protein